MTNYYQVLGVGSNATPEEIIKTYKSLSLVWHPDRFGQLDHLAETREEAEEKIKEINEAYQILSDEESRKKYDEDSKIGGKKTKKDKLKEDIEKSILLISAEFDSYQQVTEKDLDPNLWHPCASWQEKVQSFQETSRLFYFRCQMITAIKTKIQEKQNNLIKQKVVKEIEEELCKNNLTVGELEKDNRVYKAIIEKLDEKEINWKIGEIKEAIKENINKLIKNNEFIEIEKSTEQKNNSSISEWASYFLPSKVTNFLSATDSEKKTSLQEYLGKTYSNKENNTKIIIDGGKKYKSSNMIDEKKAKSLEGGELDLSEYPNLETVIIDGDLLKSKLTSLNLTNCSKLITLGCCRNELTILDLTKCPKVETVWCTDNFLGNLKIKDCSNLKELRCENNYLSSFDYSFLNPEKIVFLDVANNNFSKRDLSCFSNFTQLKELHLGTTNYERIERNAYNRWIGSLEPLKNMAQLEHLDIRGTEISHGLEYLPDSLKKITIGTWWKDTGCEKIANQLGIYYHHYPYTYTHDLLSWRKNNPKNNRSNEENQELGKRNQELEQELEEKQALIQSLQRDKEELLEKLRQTQFQIPPK